MNKTLTIVGVIIAVAVIGGLVFYVNQNGSLVGNYNATSTPTGGTNTDGTNPGTGTTQQASAPTVTTHATVTPSDTTVVVTGLVSPNGAFTSYWFEYGNSMSLGKKTANQTIGSGYAAISAPGYITGLVKNTTYYFRLVGENQYGKVLGATYSFQTTQGVPAPTGNAPAATTMAATSVTKNSATLNGEVTPNQVATQYWFEYGKTTNLGSTAGFISAGVGAAKVQVSVPVMNLDSNTTYYYRLNAQNLFGTVIGATLNFKTRPN